MTPQEILRLLDQDDVDHQDCPSNREGDACFYWRAALWSEWRNSVAWVLLLRDLGLRFNDR